MGDLLLLSLETDGNPNPATKSGPLLPAFPHHTLGGGELFLP